MPIKLSNKSFLELGLFALCPGTQDGLHDRDGVAIAVGSLLVRDCLRQTPKLIKAFRPATPVDSGIPCDERSQIGAAVSLLFHCFATVCCGPSSANFRIAIPTSCNYNRNTDGSELRVHERCKFSLPQNWVLGQIHIVSLMNGNLFVSQ